MSTNGSQPSWLTLAGKMPALHCANDGQIFSQGHNLDSGDLTNTDPLLGQLQSNGGPAWSYVLNTGYLAVDTADNTTCPAAEQRGAPRPFDGNGDGTAVCDIGAYELHLYQIYLPAVVN